MAQPHTCAAQAKDHRPSRTDGTIQDRNSRVKGIDAATGGAVALFVVYALTLAPDVTFWDAGEFIAAAQSLGIPHPPGTPLFILLANVWAKLLFFLPFAVATNLLSAVAAAAAAGITARLVKRATGSGSMAFATAIAAGGMSSVWLNATETEVYAVSLALGVLMIWTGDRAGRVGGGGGGAELRERWTYLTAYLIALAVPLHLSALVAAPVAILLAGYDGERIFWRRVAVLAGTLVFAMGVGRMSLWMGIVGAGAMLASSLVPERGSFVVRQGAPSVARHVAGALGALGVVGLASSALGFLYLRAQFDPGINQGNPDTLRAFVDVVARRQYAVSPMWPREAPVWIQLANFGQYVDWQVALLFAPSSFPSWDPATWRLGLSFGPSVFPSIPRTLFTVLFLALGWWGAVTLWRANRRMALAMIALLGCGSLGALAYLNLHAGPSIGILPDNAVREARERDYFFVFAFWAWGTLAGIGAVSSAQRLSRPAWTGILIATLPLVLNWRAVTRRGEPEQSLPRAAAEALLESAPLNAVLFVVGDNDSYPLWYAQQVLRVRPDVAVVTIPLLPTEWYRAELSRRHFLLTEKDVARFQGRRATVAAIADGARRLGRPVAAAMTLTAEERSGIGKSWTVRGLSYVEGAMPIDSVAAHRWAAWVDRRVPKRDTRQAIDPVNSYFRRLLDCPRQFQSLARNSDSTRLDSVCNYR